MNQNIQDIYAEPKILKRKRKKEVNEGIENPLWNPTSGPLGTKEIISSIVPVTIPNLDRNFDTKVQGRHIALKGSKQDQSKKHLGGPPQVRKKGPNDRQVRFLELEQLIKIEQQRYKYENFIPLHKLWLQYMSELLEVKLKIDGDQVEERRRQTSNNSSITLAEGYKGIPSISNMQSKLLKADYHGAYMTVQKAKNPALVGLNGIMIQESEQTFKIIDSNSKIKVIPKLHCIFQISLPLLPSSTAAAATTTTTSASHDQDQVNCSLSFNLFGNQFAFRPTDRVNKKFKSKSFFQL